MSSHVPGEPLTEAADGSLLLSVYVAPRASRTKCLGLHDGALKIALKAPPVDGAANAELVAFLAKQLGVPKRDVEIEQGQTNRRKRLRVRGVGAEDARGSLGL